MIFLQFSLQFRDPKSSNQPKRHQTGSLKNAANSQKNHRHVSKASQCPPPSAAPLGFQAPPSTAARSRGRTAGWPGIRPAPWGEKGPAAEGGLWRFSTCFYHVFWKEQNGAISRNTALKIDCFSIRSWDMFLNHHYSHIMSYICMAVWGSTITIYDIKITMLMIFHVPSGKLT